MAGTSDDVAGTSDDVAGTIYSTLLIGIEPVLMEDKVGRATSNLCSKRVVTALQTEYDEPLPSFAFNFNLRPYTAEPGRLERFYLKFVIIKFIAIIVCMVGRCMFTPG